MTVEPLTIVLEALKKNCGHTNMTLEALTNDIRGTKIKHLGHWVY